MEINNFKNHKSFAEQRENLLEKNNDLLYGIYEIIENQEGKIILKMKENILTCFPEKFEKLKGLKENNDILILDIKEFRNGNFRYLNKNYEKNFYLENSNLTLLSSGVLEILESEYLDKNGKKKVRNHFPTTLRDNGTIGGGIRNCVAGRNSTSDLVGDIEREYSEESPFLGVDENGNFCLFTPKRENKFQAISDLKGSIKHFLEEKYLRNPEENKKIKELFERSFRRKVKYEDLENILNEIAKNERFKFFETEILEDFEGIEMKDLKMIDEKGNIISSGRFFIMIDKNNHTIESFQIRKIFLPKGILSPTTRFFLESQNQGSKNQRLENLAKEGVIPVVEEFIKKVLDKIEN